MKNIIVVVAIFFCVFVLIVTKSDAPEGRVYDCGMAEWHPDIPKQVKEECRRIRYEEWKKEQDAKTRI